MVAECNRHPGASTNDSQLLDETDFLNFFFLCPMAGNPGNPAMSPHAGEKKGIHQTDMIHSGNKGGLGGWNNPETMLKRRTALQQT